MQACSSPEEGREAQDGRGEERIANHGAPPAPPRTLDPPGSMMVSPRGLMGMRALSTWSLMTKTTCATKLSRRISVRVAGAMDFVEVDGGAIRRLRRSPRVTFLTLTSTSRWSPSGKRFDHAGLLVRVHRGRPANRPSSRTTRRATAGRSRGSAVSASSRTGRGMLRSGAWGVSRSRCREDRHLCAQRRQSE